MRRGRKFRLTTERGRRKDEVKREAAEGRRSNAGAGRVTERGVGEEPDRWRPAQESLRQTMAEAQRIHETLRTAAEKAREMAEVLRRGAEEARRLGENRRGAAAPGAPKARRLGKKRRGAARPP